MCTMRLFLAVTLASLLSGCVMSQGQLRRDADFSAQSPHALLMFGVDIQSNYKSPLLTFRKYDPQTGKVDLSDLYHASPRTDQMSGGQKFGAAMSGQSSRPGGHDYFVIGLPPGDWFLWAMSGFYSDGVAASYSSTTFFSNGTIVIHATPGTASYIGEYSVAGKFGEDLILAPAASNFAAAQSELRTFPNVRQELIEVVPRQMKFTCVEKLSIVGKFPCDPASIVLSD
jgi:hypothetical protein